MTRIAITGLGAITALGPSRETTWQRLVDGESGIVEIRSWDSSLYPTHHGGEAQTFVPSEHLDRRQVRRWDRCHQLAVVAARETIADAGIDAGEVDRSRAGIIIGSSLGGTPSWQQFDKQVRNGRRGRGRFIYEYPLHVCLDRLTAETGFLGPRVVASTACTASTIAIGFALDAIRGGQADIVLTGGVDPLAELSFAGFSSMKAVAPVACAPFSLPVGMTTGEAAGFLLLEPLERALDRGAHVYAEVVSHQFTTDAYHATAGDPTGTSQRRAIEEALVRSGIAAEDVDYVNAHGTGTTTNDAIESRLVQTVFGQEDGGVPVSTVKGALGHTLGAAGGIEALATALAVSRDLLPPTANFTKPRPGADVDCIPNKGREHPVRVAVTQNFAFGGNNAAVTIRKHDLEGAAAPELPRRRVVITGLGMITPIGAGKEELIESLRSGRGGVDEIRTFDPSGLFPSIAGTIPDFEPSRFTRAKTRRMDRYGQLTVCGAELALGDAGLKVSRENSHRIGIVVGTTVGPLPSVAAFHVPIAAGEPQKCNPGIFPNSVVNAGAGQAAIQLRVKGCNVALSNGQASGISAIAHAYEHVAFGGADLIIAGAVEELERSGLEAYSAAWRTPPYLGHATPDDPASCAFDRRRCGMIPGEGAVLVAVEALDSALARGARIYGEILGHHVCADVPVELGWDPSGEGVVRCMQTAMQHAGVDPSDVDFVGAGALSHPLHDRIEAIAIARLFGPAGVPVAALSSSLGGSAVHSPTTLAATLLGMEHGFLPGGCELDDLDPDCDVDVVSGGVRPGDCDVAVINAASYGGSNASLVVRRFDASS